MKLLYLVHRIPYPPDKGDKIRSFHWLKALAERHEVHLATFCDDPADLEHRAALEELCVGVHLISLAPKKARIKSLTAIPVGGPLSLKYFESAEMKAQLAELARTHQFDALLGYSAPMAIYREGFENVPMVMDMVDVDSAKFASYGKTARRPQRWIYALEGKRLARYEEQLARDLDAVVLCTEPEAELLRDRVKDHPEARIEAITNGVSLPDATGLTLADTVVSPRFVFVGAMDLAACGLEASDAVTLTGPAGSISIHHGRIVHGSALNTSDRDRRLLFYEIMAADAFPVTGSMTRFEGIEDYDSRMLCGRPTLEPRLEKVPVRIPQPQPDRAKSIYEIQSGLHQRAFKRI